MADASVMTNEFHPTRVIVLSELSTREKEIYYKIMIENESLKFHRDASGRFVANVRLLAPFVKKADIETRKKEVNNYAISFQKRLLALKEEGFITVTVVGVEQFDSNAYPRFTALIAFNGDTVRPKPRMLSWVMKIVEDLYDSRFSHEKTDVEREDDTANFDLMLLIFPVFVVRRLGTNIGLKSLVDQTCWDLLYNTHMYRRDYLELEVFARFLQEFYDHDDLLFFLYVRSVISKVLHVNFKNRWVKPEGPGRQPTSLWMSYRECAHVARIVFGSDNDNMYREFMGLITPQMLGQKTDTADSRRIDITEYLHLSVVGYHNSQSQAKNNSPGGGGGNERYLAPLPGQTAPVGTVPVPENENMMYNSYERQQNEQYDYEEEEEDRGRGVAEKDLNYFDAESEEKQFKAEGGHDEVSGLDMQFSDTLGSPAAGGRGGGRGREGASTASKSERTGQTSYGSIADDTASVSSQQDAAVAGSDVRETVIPLDSAPAGVAAPEPNEFEELQNEREEEFMAFLCAPLAELLPQDYVEYVAADLGERLKQTVNVYLADKEITDLDTLDDYLVEFMQLDQLRIDLEASRDEIVQYLLSGQEDGTASIASRVSKASTDVGSQSLKSKSRTSEQQQQKQPLADGVAALKNSGDDDAKSVGSGTGSRSGSASYSSYSSKTPSRNGGAAAEGGAAATAAAGDGGNASGAVKEQQQQQQQQQDESGKDVAGTGQQPGEEKDAPQQQVDENGNPLFFDEEGNQVFYDEEGNQVFYDEEGNQVFFDEEGNQVFFDEEGNQVFFDENGQQVFYDEEGNQVFFDENGQQFFYDEEGNPYYADEAAGAAATATGATGEGQSDEAQQN